MMGGYEQVVEIGQRHYFSNELVDGITVAVCHL